MAKLKLDLHEISHRGKDISKSYTTALKRMTKILGVYSSISSFKQVGHA
jgi:hypothetical protein